jgi:hypothetical protein
MLPSMKLKARPSSANLGILKKLNDPGEGLISL